MAVDLNQTITPATALTGFLARLLDSAGAPGEGLCFGGATAVGDLPSGTAYPAFLALVTDELGQVWPVGDVNPSAITFVDSDGACTLYLSPFSTSELPTMQAGRLGAFTLLAQLTASDPPSDALALGSGTVTAGAFTTWTEAAGVRRDSLSAGSGKGGDIAFYARTGAANPPGLRFHSVTSQWQYSTDGTTWHTLGESGGVTSFNGRTGAVTPQSGDYTAAQVTGAVPATRAVNTGSGLTGGGALSADLNLAVSYGTTADTACQGNDARLSNARTPTAHAGTHAAGQGDAVTPAAIGAIPSTARETANGVAGLDVNGKLAGARQVYGTLADTACQGNDSRLSDNAKLSGSTFTGAVVISNGKLELARGSAYGPPATGSFSEGDRWWDAAGAEWLYAVVGASGAWYQVGPGAAIGNWTSATISGYWVREAGVGDWTYSTAASRWVGAEQTLQLEAVPSGAGGAYDPVNGQAGSGPHHWASLDTTYNWVVTAWGWDGYCASGLSASAWWDNYLINAASSDIGSGALELGGVSNNGVWRHFEKANQAVVVETDANTRIGQYFTRVSAPGNVFCMPFIKARPARK